MRLDDLGKRICIVGPSNSGKSTLAAAIGRSRSLPVVHLDQYRHHPGTQWLERSDAEFEVLHDAAVKSDQWVIEGNYSKWMPDRLARATGLVLLEASSIASVGRYARRTWGRGERAGGLEGTRDRLSVRMITFILGPTRRNRRQYRLVFDEFDGPKVFLSGRRALRAFYSDNSLTLDVR